MPPTTPLPASDRGARAGACRAACWLLALLLALGLSGAQASAIDALIERTLASRSAAPAQFDSLLQELDGLAPAATPEQQRYIRYLHAYKLTFTGDFAGSNRELERLGDGASPQALRVRVGALRVNNYAAMRQFPEGLAALDEFLPLLEQTADVEPRHQGFLSAAIFYNQLGQFDLGRRMTERVLAEEASPRSRCFAENLTIEALIGSKAALPADWKFLEVIDQCRAAGELAAAGFVGINLARKMQAEQRIDAAIDVLERQRDDIAGTRYPRLIGESEALLAELKFAVGDWAAAERHARSAVQLSAGTRYSLPIVIAHHTLYQLAERRGDSAAALVHYRNYAEADKAYLDDVKARELAFQMARHESVQKTQTIELLNRRNEVLQLEQEVARRSTQIFGLLATLAALLAASIAFWAFKIKRLQVAFRTLAETDALTGLSNRQHFTQQAQRALDECRRSGAPATLVMFDLDRFKQINDRYGHAVGDWVLAQVARAQLAVCGDQARIGRLGGEEFALLVPDVDCAAARGLAERCRSATAAIDTGESGHRFAVSASFGLADTRSAGYDLHKLMVQADEAMYRAKREGRDRVSTFGMPAAA